MNEDIEVWIRVFFWVFRSRECISNRANALLNLGQLNESLEDCIKSISYDKNYSNPYFVLLTNYSKAGHENKAIEYLKNSAQLGNRNAQATLREIGL